MIVDNFRLQLGKQEYVPLVIGGMGVNISTTELALAAERLGGIGHISDAETDMSVINYLEHPLSAQKENGTSTTSTTPTRRKSFLTLEK